mgnify:CR=1 FL=1
MKLLNIASLFRKKQNRKSVSQKIELDTKKAIERGRKTHTFGGANDRDTRAIYLPQRKKLKGYQKQGLRTFNKNK